MASGTPASASACCKRCCRPRRTFDEDVALREVDALVMGGYQGTVRHLSDLLAPPKGGEDMPF